MPVGAVLVFRAVVVANVTVQEVRVCESVSLVTLLWIVLLLAVVAAAALMMFLPSVVVVTPMSVGEIVVVKSSAVATKVAGWRDSGVWVGVV